MASGGGSRAVSGVLGRTGQSGPPSSRQPCHGGWPGPGRRHRSGRRCADSDVGRTRVRLEVERAAERGAAWRFPSGELQGSFPTCHSGRETDSQKSQPAGKFRHNDCPTLIYFTINDTPSKWVK